MNYGESRTIEMAISQQNIDDQIAALLYGFGVVHDNEDITKIELGTGDQNVVPLKFTVTTRR